MRALIFAALAIFSTGCATLSPSAEVKKERLEWVLNPDNKAEMDQFYASQKECADFAFKSKVAGSPYFESDIQTGCLKRKGYKTRLVAIEGAQ